MSASSEVEGAAPAPKPRRSPWLPLALLAVAGVMAIALFAYARHRQRKATELPKIAQVPELDVRDQRDQPFHAANMRGAIWVVDFIFTHCPTVCPRLTARMAELQTRVEKLKVGKPIKLLSISVDPENDTPEVLAAYAQKHGAHEPTWYFVAGETADLDRVVVQGFKQRYDKPDPTLGITEVMHGDRFMLIDDALTIRAYYDTRELDVLDRIVSDIERVADP